MVELVTYIGKRKTSKMRDNVHRIAADSGLILSVERDNYYLRRIYIELRGELKHIPILKNRKPKFGGTDRTVVAKLRTMDRLFALEAQRQGFTRQDLSFGSRKVFISLITATGNRTTNEDNVLTTVRDWLEPRSKLVGVKKKKRGWGIGVIIDDIQARGIALKAEDLGVAMEYSRIVIEPYEAVRESLISFFQLSSEGIETEG